MTAGQEAAKQKIERVLRQLAHGVGDERLASGLQTLFDDLVVFYEAYWGQDTSWAYVSQLQGCKTEADAFVAAAHEAARRGMHPAAVTLADFAVRTAPNNPHVSLLQARLLRKAGRTEQARAICKGLRNSFPDLFEIDDELFMCDVEERFWSRDYYRLLADIHATCQPQTYLEIGVATGKSLALARSGTVVTGVDPASAEQAALQYHSPENVPRLYKMTSDEYFATQDFCAETTAACLDLAFIDGLHHFDQVLKDFANLERYAGPNTLICIHDCLPIHDRVASRARSTGFWTGDVWKVIPCLRQVRPDLEIVTIPVQPSGLALIRRLNPDSRVLSRQHDALVRHFENLVLPERWEDTLDILAVEMDENSFRLEQFLPSGRC